MKTIKKTILCIIVCLTLATSAFAVDIDRVNISNQVPGYGDNVNTEQVKWYTAVIDGVKYKRLWSITYGKWLTDWIPIG